MSGKSNFETVLTWIVVGILAIVALKVVFTVLGLAFVVGGFLLRVVLPLVLLVWVALKVVQWLGGRNGGAGSQESMDL